MKPLVVGVAGGTGSGKTTVVRRIVETLGAGQVSLIEQDAYYRDGSHLPFPARAARNYDHPDAIDEPLLAQHVAALKAGGAVEVPCYDFVEHVRRPETRRIEARPCVVVEGILVLASEGVRDLLDLRLFVDTDADLRFIRRLERDTRERGRTPESVVEQWQATVRPMHLLFVEPSKRHAHLVIPEGGLNEPALEVITTHLRTALGRGVVE
ncbi:MAG: uridine kinase [Actinomycetota bacterium]